MDQHRQTFVGRRAERDGLIDHLSARQHRPGGPVLVSGEAGIGKSRLLAEVAEGAASDD